MKSQSLAERFYDLFVINNEAYGLEDQNGWRTVKAKLTIKEIEDHLKGKYCLGLFPFNRKGWIKWLAIDLDYKGGDLEYEYLTRKFDKNSVLIVDTGGRGTHLFVILQPTPIWQISQKINEIEDTLKRRVFPKQREIKPETIGNFIRAPLGYHFHYKRWSRIVRGDIWTVKPFVTCMYRVYDQYGDGNCTYYDGSIGYCQQDFCPKFLR